jgi:nitrate/TMAO reductase-like tetraheme cytochrome c subunit
MTTDPKPALPRLSIFRNWISLFGLLLSSCSLVGFCFLMTLEVMTGGANPYIGIIAFLVVPMFMAMGLATIGLGLLLEKRKMRRGGTSVPPPILSLDFSQPRVRRNLLIAAGVGLVVMMASAIMLYGGYHYTESSKFCGLVCHTVMKPEYTTYQHSPHARLSCAECHIGSGASWYVKSKVSGLRQVFATILNTYSRPIETPVKNLRPAQETCEQCHWPSKFTGNLDRLVTRYMSDETNTPYSIRLLLKVGGGDPTHGPVGGIHWHMNVGNKIEYIATDSQRQTIPWVRKTDPKGVVTEFSTKGFTPDPSKHVIRRMDCMDCHNRPSHIFRSPAEAVDMSLALGTIDPTMPKIKKTAVDILTQPYTTEQEAREKIAASIKDKYPGDPRLQSTIAEILKIYADNFFPEMKTSWKNHPNNLGHMEFPGCFRCHDGEHKSPDGLLAVKANDCNVCHIIVAQGRGEQLEKLSAKGHDFEHPGGDLDETKCSDCHTGGPQ